MLVATLQPQVEQEERPIPLMHARKLRPRTSSRALGLAITSPPVNFEKGAWLQPEVDRLQDRDYRR